MPFVTSKDGTRIGYSVIGSGPPLILVDGALCWRDSGPATPLAEASKDAFTVYTYDRRGRGESGDTKPYAIEREVEDLQALVAAAGGRVHVYGISSGAVLALETASRTDAIGRMVLYEAPLIVDDTRKPLAPDYVATMDRYVAEGNGAAAVRHFLKNGVRVPAFGIFMMGLMGAFRKMAPAGRTLPYDTALTARYQMGKPLPPGEWSGVTMPVLCIGGSKSDAWMQNAQMALATTLPNAKHMTLGGQNHMVAASAIAPVIKRFLAEA